MASSHVGESSVDHSAGPHSPRDLRRHAPAAAVPLVRGMCGPGHTPRPGPRPRLPPARGRGPRGLWRACGACPALCCHPEQATEHGRIDLARAAVRRAALPLPPPPVRSPPPPLPPAPSRPPPPPAPRLASSLQPRSRCLQLPPMWGLPQPPARVRRPAPRAAPRTSLTRRAAPLAPRPFAMTSAAARAVAGRWRRRRRRQRRRRPTSLCCRPRRRRSTPRPRRRLGSRR